MQAEFNEKLIGRVAAGDGSAFREIYEVTSSAVYGYALSILKNRHDAEDVMHDAYIKLYENASLYRPQGKPLAYLLTIVRNLCISRLRKDRPAEYTEDLSPSAAANADPSLSESRLLIESVLQILSSEESQIVILHALTGWKMREIAHLTGIPLPTVLSKYNRALKKMKTALVGKE